MELDTISLTIANGQSLSDAADLSSVRAVGLIGPTAFDGTSVNFETSIDGVTWHPLLNVAGSSVLVAVPASGVERWMLFDQTVEWQNLTWLKLKSTSTQTADRTVNLVVRPRQCTLTLEC
jgi:hypothetical protein